MGQVNSLYSTCNKIIMANSVLCVTLAICSISFPMCGPGICSNYSFGLSYHLKNIYVEMEEGVASTDNTL